MSAITTQPTNARAHLPRKSTPAPQALTVPTKARPHPFGLGIAEHEDLVWLTSHATGGVIFSGTARQLMERADLVAACSLRQREDLARAGAHPAAAACSAAAEAVAT